MARFCAAGSGKFTRQAIAMRKGKFVPIGSNAANLRIDGRVAEVAEFGG